MEEIKVLIGPSTFGAQDSTPVERLAKSGFKVIKNPFGRKLTPRELAQLLPGVQVLIAGLEILDRVIMENSDLEVISRCGAGLSNIDLGAAKKLGIKVFYTPDAPTTSVAELTVGAMVSLVRYVAQMDRDLHKGNWSKKIGIQLGGSTIAIIGFGRIGRRVAELLRSFGARLVAVDLHREDSVEGVIVLPLDEALSQADIVTVHASGDMSVIGPREFSLMKRGVFILNCARGSVIDEVALKLALDEGKVAGAWIDCFRDEPYAGPLTLYPQVILTPHVGSYTVECRRQMETQAVDNVINFFKEAR